MAIYTFGTFAHTSLNNGGAPLPAGLTGDSLTFTVQSLADASRFGTANVAAGTVFFIWWESEILKVNSGGAGSLTWTAVRGQFGTPAPAHGDGSQIRECVPGLVLSSFLQSGGISGELSVSDLKLTGVTGASSSYRLMGATTVGAPVAGTFQLNDIVLDIGNKEFWLCTAAGTPGTWVAMGGGGGSGVSLNSQGVIPVADMPPGSVDIDATVLEGDLLYHHTPTSVAIGFIGDSITALAPSGGNTPPNNCATDLTTGIFTAVPTNRGIGGTRSVDWLIGDASNNLVNAMAAFASNGVTVVHIMLGTNDSQDPADLVSAATYKANLAAICASLNAAGYVCVLSYPPYTVPGSLGLFTATSNTLQRAYQTSIDQLVNGTTIRQGDVNAYSYFSGHSAELSDGVHPTTTGSLDLATFWANALRPIVTAPLKRLAVGTTGTYVRSNGTDPAYSTISLGDLPSIPLSQLDQSGAVSGNVPTWNGAAFVPLTPAAGVVYAPLTSGHEPVEIISDGAGGLVLAPFM